MRVTLRGGGTAAGWPLEALEAAIARAQEVGADGAAAPYVAGEIQRALVQVQRVCREAERAAKRALARLTGGSAS